MEPRPADLIVLGLDPGSRVTGWGIVAERGGSLALIDAGTIKLAAQADMAVRLGRIYEELAGLIAEHRPLEAAIENVFVNKNTLSALKLGQARGAAIAACAVAGLPVAGYEPTLVKKSIVGTGRAEKEQVAFMVGRLLGTTRRFALDASDALAVAVCHLNERRLRRLAKATGAKCS
ncbi:Crossover junction endodeoxyribonuclease ruvC [Desulfovibrio sp. X2]|uniref:crossover junction endodeoxyribonuclease RuvC n=1 Tax=Desulfovibrio sp. X2 TaxID=941449 RepID=UPI000358D597|nr:crossover junction endodeoxyribonuclease RuvC [Desulfovibrio sp. X2]EPR42742.1 Crossover junction endodeoxyribonuclease ruvC [Desulfovibrio sp. X2]